MKKTELEALIHLLEDPDERIFEHVRSRIEELGLGIIDELEDAWINSLDPFLQARIEEVISSIQRDNLKSKIRLWLAKNPNDLIQGAILIAKYQYPDLDSGDVRKNIENIQQAVWLELHENLTPLEKVNIFNQVFYGTFGFGGNLKNVFNPQNNFIQICINRKKGSPIMLGLIYLAIAQNLGFPMFGLNLPYHFALAYCAQPQLNRLNPDGRKVMFYINPIASGIVFSRNEIKDYLKRMRVEETDSHFRPVDNKTVVKSLFEQVKTSYINHKDLIKADEIQELINIFSEDLA